MGVCLLAWKVWYQLLKREETYLLSFVLSVIKLREIVACFVCGNE